MVLCFCLLACSNLPDVPHAHVSEETKRAEYQVGDMTHFICEPGYISDQISKYVCKSDGWLAVRQGKCYCELDGLLFSFFIIDWVTAGVRDLGVIDHVEELLCDFVLVDPYYEISQLIWTPFSEGIC